MSKAVRFTSSIPVSEVTSPASKHTELGPIAIFSGLGLLVSLVAILWGVQGVWF